MPLLPKINRLLVTWFGCGYFPKAPGTAGSVGALPLCWLLSSHAPVDLRILFAIAVTGLAIFTAAQDQRVSHVKDPSYVVIDEVAGMLWTTLLLAPQVTDLAIGFGLFRLFDILKPFPGNYFDRKSKTSTNALHRGAYIVLDDVIAGVYACCIGLAIKNYFQN